MRKEGEEKDDSKFEIQMRHPGGIWRIIIGSGNLISD